MAEGTSVPSGDGAKVQGTFASRLQRRASETDAALEGHPILLLNIFFAPEKLFGVEFD